MQVIILWLFMLNDKENDDNTIDYFTPCACTQGNNYNNILEA